MAMKMIFVLLIAAFLSSCRSSNDKKAVTASSKYTVIDEEVLEIPGKAQISTYVLYNDTIYKEDVLKKIAFEIYGKNQKKLLKDNQLAKIFMVYIYSKKSEYESGKTKYIAMLYKGLSKQKAEIAYNIPQRIIPERYPEPIVSEENSISPGNSKEVAMKANEKYFSAWNGSNPEFVKVIKDRMNDPDSFQHVETSYADKGSYLRIQMTFRGKNAFDATVTSIVTCTFDKSTRIISDLN